MANQIITDISIKTIDNDRLSPSQNLNMFFKNIVTNPKFTQQGAISISNSDIDFNTSLASFSSTHVQLYSQQVFFLKCTYDASFNLQDADETLNTFTIKTNQFSYFNRNVPVIIQLANGSQDVDPSTGDIILSPSAIDIKIDYLLVSHDTTNFQDQNYSPTNVISSGTF